LQALPPLPAAFYRDEASRVAPLLLGKILLRRERDGVVAGRIVEVEAYLGHDDPAAHSAAGRTARNYVMFGPPGRAYVYFSYGNHWCLNISTSPAGEAGAILFRAVEPVAGEATMARARRMDPPRANDKQRRLLTSGPGRLAQAFGVTRQRDNEKDFTDPASDLVIVDDGFVPPAITVTPRIGISKAVERPLRFLIAGNSFVSGRRR
jgi:DNA-3-methyladenine glycosylase